MNVLEKLKSMEYGPAPENAAKVNEWLEQNERSFGHFIGGQFTKFNKVDFFESKNPATGQVLARISQANADDVDKAVSAARRYGYLLPH